MKYINEIKAFYGFAQDKQLSTGQIALWHALMYINNKVAWAEWFTVANISLEINTGLSRQGIIKARNVLKQYGLIDFRSNGTRATSYTIRSIADSVQDSVQDSIQVGVQDGSALNKQDKTRQDKKRKNTKKENPAGFDRFWQAYPRKDGKANALKSWRKISPDEALLETIIDAVTRQKQGPNWQKEGGKYIPFPATWLNQRRWEDRGVDLPAAGNAHNPWGGAPKV